MNDLLRPVWPFKDRCPRKLWAEPGYPHCQKRLVDYKCPQHGLIREAMPKT